TGQENEDETVTLTVPGGFNIVEGDATQPVPKLPRDAKSGNRPVTWKVRAGPTGKYEFTVKTRSGLTQTIPVEVKNPIFLLVWRAASPHSKRHYVLPLLHLLVCPVRRLGGGRRLGPGPAARRRQRPRQRRPQGDVPGDAHCPGPGDRGRPVGLFAAAGAA